MKKLIRWFKYAPYQPSTLICNDELPASGTLILCGAVRQLDWFDHKSGEHLAHRRMIVDGEHKIRLNAGKGFGKFLKVTDFEVVNIIWHFIVRRIKKKQGCPSQKLKRVKNADIHQRLYSD